MKLSIAKLNEIREEFGDFDLGVTYGSGRNYLRFGYWNQIDVNRLQEILGSSIFALEQDDYDDDCGWKYSYDLYDHAEWKKSFPLSELN